MVASFDEITTELYDRSPIEENIIPEITFNFKIRLSDKLAPLYVFFSYPENQHNKAISYTYLMIIKTHHQIQTWPHTLIQAKYVFRV
jgi:hypothetical protein